ncbi:hypothetical protein [Metabacillus malikii]|uniref:Uncharacterized protein n=1 Tax=Metabacillus malikii TaxID=1504265 RepID=A0ABT9ZHN2_9BACI|nr:hypothetical protein [Metabacillus malikii]MDQ0231781.1 hypothetical protein [Metabacillus malikii]
MENFVNLTNAEIAKLISKAEYQVVYIAPAMEVIVANEIVKFVQRTSLYQVSISLDLSTEVYREGYGDPAALDILLNSGIRLKETPGLRIGILLIDDYGWIFSPVSKTTSPNLENNKFNAHLEALNANILEGYLIIPKEPEQVTLFDIAVQENTTQMAEEDESSVIEEKVENIKKDIEAEPLPDFDALQLLSDYRSFLQFIDITFSGSRLDQKTVKLPSELLIVTQDKNFEEKMRATYKLFNEEISEHTKGMKEKIDRLREKYTYSLSRKYGRIILVEKKKDFEIEYNSLVKELEKHKEKLVNYIDSQIDITQKILIDYFTPVLQKNPPNHLKDDRGNLLDVNEIRNYIDWLLDREFPNSQHLLNRIHLDYTYKDITEETIKDERFLNELDKALKDEPIRFSHRDYQQEMFDFKRDNNDKNIQIYKKGDVYYIKSIRSRKILTHKIESYTNVKYFDDYAIVGAEMLLNKNINYSEFSSEMIKMFGDSTRLLMKAIYAQSQYILELSIDEIEEMLSNDSRKYR